MSKADDKRAAIVAAQALREAAEREARGGQAGTPGKSRGGWAASAPMRARRRGRPPKPTE